MCRMLWSAAAADCEVSEATKVLGVASLGLVEDLQAATVPGALETRVVAKAVVDVVGGARAVVMVAAVTAQAAMAAVASGVVARAAAGTGDSSLAQGPCTRLGA